MEQHYIKESLSVEELGDCTPSQVLQSIQQPLGNMTVTMDAILMQELFLQRMTPNVRMVITPSAAALTLDQPTQLADQIVEASPTSTIAATDTNTQLTTQVTNLRHRPEECAIALFSTTNTFSLHPQSPSSNRRHKAKKCQAPYQELRNS